MSVKIYNVNLNDIRVKKPTPTFVEYLVVQTSGNQIIKLDTSGNILGTPISNSIFTIESASPTLALDLDNNIYTASSYGVKKFDFDGSELWALSLGSSAINGITLDKDNKVYAASAENYVKTILPDGTNANQQYATGPYDARSVSVNKNGSILIGTTSDIRKINSNDNFTISSNNVHDVFIDNNEQSYVAEAGTNTIYRKYLESGVVDWSVTSIKNTDSIVADRDGNSYVGTGFNSDPAFDYSISKVDPTGTVLWTQNETNTVQSVVVDQNGNVYTSNRGGYVTKYDPNGNQLWRNTSFGGNQVRSIAITGGLPSQW